MKKETNRRMIIYMVIGICFVILTLVMVYLMLTRAVNVSKWNSDFKSSSENESVTELYYDIYPF